MKTEVLRRNYVIQTVAHALDLLELFQESNSELGITDLSNRLHLHKNNVFRLVATLNDRNYIEKNSVSGKYRLGVKTRALGHLAGRQTDFQQYARPALLRLNQFSRETCYFSMISGSHAYYLDAVESDLPVRVRSWVGARRPLYCSASGKVQLAFLAKNERENILAGLEFTRTADAPTTAQGQRLIDDFDRIVRLGYAIEDQECDAGVVEIAAPVFDCCGGAIGAISISGPSMRFSDARIRNELVPFLCQEAELLSTQLT